MRLDRLLEPLASAYTLTGDPAVEVTSITHDSRQVGPGTLFCCLPGERLDGHDFAEEAGRRGAVALLCERDLRVPLPQAVVADARAAMAPLAAALHGHPSRRLRVIGVTGTDGKTTTVHLLRAVLEAQGWRTGTIGTLTGLRTTPEATELQARLAAMADEGDQAVAMEVSSHALALHRVDGTWFEVAVFTNLGRDHLDFHPSVEAYFEVKSRLFEPERTAAAVVNLDDPHGRLLKDAARVPTVGYTLADASDLVVEADASTFTWRGQPVRVPLGGRFNVSNALAAATTAEMLGIPTGTVVAGLAAAGPVPGRFEAVDAGQPFRVLIDYAHTPDGLENLLAAAREVATGRVIVVFGAGGRRDHSKRPGMGEVASRLADRIYLTSDNPRGEDPLVIIEQIRSGMKGEATIEPDRAAAIAAALAEAGAGDVVVVAGKGHETTQDLGDQVVPFDDREVVRRELAG